MNQDFYKQKAELEKTITEVCQKFAVKHTTELNIRLSVSLNIARMFGCVADAAVGEIEICVSTKKLK